MIAGSSFRIRTVMQHDLADLLILLSDTSKQGGFVPLEMSSQARMQAEFIQDGFWTDRSRQLVIVDEEDKVFGLVWIFQSVPYFDAFELGFKIFDEGRRGGGIMTEALTLIVDFVFSSFKVNRLEIRCDVDNKAAVRVASKLGFEHEGTSRKAAFTRGEHRDIDVFALLRESWKSGCLAGAAKSALA